MRGGVTLLLALTACLAVLRVSCDPSSTLVLVYAVNRHGTRNVLKKTSLLTDAPYQPQGDVRAFRSPPALRALAAPLRALCGREERGWWAVG